jgi:hypothetical protein
LAPLLGQGGPSRLPFRVVQSSVTIAVEPIEDLDTRRWTGSAGPPRTRSAGRRGNFDGAFA